MADDLDASGAKWYTSLLPLDVSSCVRREPCGDEVLFPEEARFIAGAVERRRLEFATVRACARTALSRLGYPAEPLLPGSCREPLWPTGAVGAMTHCRGMHAAAVASACAYAAIGIDAEPREELPADLIGTVAAGQEVDMLGELKRAAPEIPWSRLLFSAKESVFKAWFPLTRTWLGFDDCRIELGQGFWIGRINPLLHGVTDGTLTHMRGRWIVTADHVVTAACLPATSPIP